MPEPETYIPPDPPATLHRTGRELWASVCIEHELTDEVDLALLERACSASDREAQARRRIRDDGLFLEDRFGKVYAHPASALEAKARSQAATILGQLERARLNVERLDLAVEREIRMRGKDMIAQTTRRDRRGGGVRHVG